MMTLLVLMSLLASCFFLCSVPVVEVTLGSESVSTGGAAGRLELTSAAAESGLGEQVVELASPFSTPMCGCERLPGAMVHVDTVLVEVVVNTLDLTEVEAVRPVDLRVGVTVAEGLVKAAGLLSLSTRGLMGLVPMVAPWPAR